MAMGLPVVASNAGGNVELVTHELGDLSARLVTARFLPTA